MGQELPADFLGDEWKGYVVRITGGNDRQDSPFVRYPFAREPVVAAGLD